MTTHSLGYQYPAFLKLYTGKIYDDYGFDEEYFQTLLALMGADASKTDMSAFVLAHFETLSTFLQSEQREAQWLPIDTENKALTKVQTLAKKLAYELAELQMTGQAGQRLHDEISAKGNAIFSHDGATLSDLLGQPECKPFEGITDLLFDLRVALERAKIQKPKPLKRPKFSGDAKKSAAAHSEHAVRVVAASGRTEGLDAHYRERARQHALPANFALLAFMMQFEEMWHEYSDLPFTEGKHEPDARQSISRTVDAAEHCLRKYGATCPRSLIERKVRQVRELRYEVQS